MNGTRNIRSYLGLNLVALDESIHLAIKGKLIEVKLPPSKIAWVVEQIFEQPTAAMEALEEIKPREDIIN